MDVFPTRAELLAALLSNVGFLGKDCSPTVKKGVNLLARKTSLEQLS